MLKTKTRTVILALVASVSVASATVAPAVSQAQPNWPALGHAIHCESLLAGAEAYRGKAEAAEAQGHPNLAQYYHEEEYKYFAEMDSEGCARPIVNRVPGTTPVATTPPPSAKLR